MRESYDRYMYRKYQEYREEVRQRKKELKKQRNEKVVDILTKRTDN